MRSIGQQVLRTEADAIHALADGLGQSFDDAAEALLAVTGRVVVCGMGKSGHIARKIAATLASTGTPAQFVHPGEASHGDLGMVTRDDAVLLMSYSGETAELADVIAHTRRNGITLIGIACQADSTLLKKADIAIHMPKAKEAALDGLAPTTSTTMMLALGDALAAVLLERRGFTPDDFRSFHPGGSLGARLARVADLMHAGDAVPVVHEDAAMGDVLIEITGKGFGISAVTRSDGTLCGVITDGDLRRNMSDLMDRRAGEVMSADPTTVTSDIRASAALAIMYTLKITCLIVQSAETKAPVGILHIHDCLRAGVS